MFKKLINTIIWTIIISIPISASAVTMYSAVDGRTMEVSENEVEIYRQLNWCNGKPVTMYSLDGRTLIIGENDVEMYRQVNWYYGRPVTMYSLDGRTLIIGENDIEMYRQVNWYYGRPVTMYAPDGRTLTIGENDVEMYKAVGWYTAPVGRNVVSFNTNVLNAIGDTFASLEQRYGEINQSYYSAGASVYKLGWMNVWGAFYERGSYTPYLCWGDNKGDYGYIQPDPNSVCVAMDCTAGDLFNNMNGKSYTLDEIYNMTGKKFTYEGKNEMWVDEYGNSPNTFVTQFEMFWVCIDSSDYKIDENDWVFIKANDYDTVRSMGY